MTEVVRERGNFGEIMGVPETHRFEGVSEPAEVRIEYDGRNYFAVVDIADMTRAGGGVNKKEALASLANMLRQTQNKMPADIQTAREEIKAHLLGIADTEDHSDALADTPPAEAA